MTGRKWQRMLWLIALGSTFAFADPVGSPGLPLRWAPALKQAIGTSYEADSGHRSPIWFTLSEGILSEVFYPNVDRAEVGDLQFVVTDGSQFFSDQRKDTISKVNYVDEGMVVQVDGADKAGHYTFRQEYVTDGAAPVLRIHTTMKLAQSGLKVFILFKPALNNSGGKNLGAVDANGLFVSYYNSRGKNRIHSLREPVSVGAALLSSLPWKNASVGYVGFSDGWQDLSKNFEMTETSRQAGPGNIALTGELQLAPGQTEINFDLALGFGQNTDQAAAFASTSLQVPFQKIKTEYSQGWLSYLDHLQKGAAFLVGSTFARRSAQIIKMHEDKENRGAIVASLSKPAIPDSDRAEDGIGGYHLVWPRDLYHAAMGLLAAGDRETPVNTLHYLIKTQRADGSWPQNFWVDGNFYWHGLQMDEVSFPILLASHLHYKIGYQLKSEDEDMIRKAASFITAHGPATNEDRWEEIGGFVPSTVAAEIAALRQASRLLSDPYIGKIAEEWQSSVETWMLVKKSALGENYYLRTSPNGTPDIDEKVGLANGAGDALASQILDGGFLELVRLGIREPNDPRILSTLALYESDSSQLMARSFSWPGSTTYRRYTRDAYGVSHVGGYWPLLAGERGIYSVHAGNLDKARAELYILEHSAIHTGMIPEQTVDVASPSGVQIGLGVACPLVWAHAEDILLHRSIEEGIPFDAPRD